MTVMWRYFEKDAYHPAWVKFSMNTYNDVNVLASKPDAMREALRKHRGTMAGWYVMFESEADLSFFLLRWS